MEGLDFALGTIEQAVEADKIFGNYVKDFGAYIGTIRSATIMNGKEPKKSRGLKLEIETEQGMIQDVFWFIGKTGKPVQFSINKIQTGLLPCVRLRTVDAVVGKDGTSYPQLVGRKVGVLVNIELSMYKNKEQSKTLIDRFFDVETNKTGSEVIGKKPAAQKEKAEKRLHVIDNRGTAAKTGESSASDPFSESKDDVSSDADPFGNDTESDTVNDTSAEDAQEEVNAKAEAEAKIKAAAYAKVAEEKVKAAVKADAEAKAKIIADAKAADEAKTATEGTSEAAPEDSEDFWNEG